MNDWKETREKVASFVAKAGLEYKILIGGDAVSARDYSVTTSPTGLLIDSEGIVQRYHNGFHPATLARMEERIALLLERQRAGKAKK